MTSSSLTDVLVPSYLCSYKFTTLDVGPDNDGYVVINGGLEVGEQIALNPDLIWDDVVDDDLASPDSSEDELTTKSKDRSIAVKQ